MIGKYLSYSKKIILSSFLGHIVWMSLSTFMIVAKNEIGVEDIPKFEFIIFAFSLIGIYIAYIRTVTLKVVVAISLMIETVFLFALYYLLYIENIQYAGISVYIVIIANAMLSVVIREFKRSFEDEILTRKSQKRILKALRKKVS